MGRLVPTVGRTLSHFAVAAAVIVLGGIFVFALGAVPSSAQTIPACEDGLDNDGDGLTDWPDDPGCYDSFDTHEYNAPAYACQNGVDDDGDGRIDWPNDPGCVSGSDADEYNPPPPPPRCQNGVDDDGDGLVDWPNDPGCTSGADDDEYHVPPPIPKCENGVDDDGDGLIDWPNDPGCTASDDNDEYHVPPPVLERCRNSVDDDADGLIDWPSDTGCASSTDNDEYNPQLPQCENNFDDDGDGKTDFPEDLGCVEGPDNEEYNPVQPPQVTMSLDEDENYVAFQNLDATYYIALRCANSGQALDGVKALGEHVGPGYISRVVRRVGVARTVAEPYDANNGLLQGVGVFGTHLALVHDTQRLDSNYYEEGVANANYCWSQPGRPGNLPPLAGVKSWDPVVQPAVINEAGTLTGVLAVEVVIGNDVADILRIRYDLRVKPTVVYQWTTVTVLCDNGLCSPDGRRYYVKEPKIVVTLNPSEAQEYSRVSCWDTSTTKWGSSALVAKFVGNNPQPGGQTGRCVGGASSGLTRGRALFDYGTSTNNPSAPVPANCTTPPSTSDRTCFVVTGRGFTPGTPLAQTPLRNWENGGYPPFSGSKGSFDQWAVKSGSSGWLRLVGDGDGCSYHSRGSPAANANNLDGQDSRRWEIYGRSPNPQNRNERGVIFKAWEGGTGPNYCYQQFARLGPAGDAWGAFNAYSFGPGWEHGTYPG
jgi:hypothetical protein